jgi:hypothetical protein
MKRKRTKPPRVVLLDTRQWANCEQAVQQLALALQDAADLEARLSALCAQLDPGLQQLLALADQVSLAAQTLGEVAARRSAGARKANATRKASADKVRYTITDPTGQDGATLPPSDYPNEDDRR